MLSARERTNQLIDQCAVWCAATGEKPVPDQESLHQYCRAAVLMAIGQQHLEFRNLSTKQRRILGGLDKT